MSGFFCLGEIKKTPHPIPLLYKYKRRGEKYFVCKGKGIWYNLKMEKDEKVKMTIDDLAVMVAKGFEGVEKDISELKKDVEVFKLETNVHFNNLETDLKSFKKEVNESVEKTKEDIVDLLDTDMLHDKRIEKLENKFV